MEIKDRVKEKTAKLDFRGALADIASLRKPVDAFFDTVMVMDKDAEVKDEPPGASRRHDRAFCPDRGFLAIGAGRRKKQITVVRSQESEDL